MSAARLVAQLGDVNPIDHGGYFVYGGERPAAERLELLGDNDPDRGAVGWEVYRFDLDACEESWHDLPAVASYVDSTEEELRRLLLSSDPVDRAQAYRAIGDYHGFDNLDSYPIRLTRTEVGRRYRRHGGHR